MADPGKQMESGSRGTEAAPGRPRRRKPLPRAALLIDTSEQREWPMARYASKHIDFVQSEWNLPEGDYAAVLLDESPAIAEVLADSWYERTAATIRGEAQAIQAVAPSVCLIERKSLPDLVGTMTRGHDRFEAECERMRGYGQRLIVIEADMPDVKRYCETESMASHRAVFGSLAAFQRRYGLHVQWAHDRRYAASWAFMVLEGWIRDRVMEIKNARQ